MTKNRTAERRDTMAVELPAWVTLPPEKPVRVMRAIKTHPGHAVVFSDSPTIPYASPSKAYDAAKGDDVVFDKSLNRKEWGSSSGGLYFCKNKRLLVSFTQEDSLYLLKASYQEFLALSKEYRKRPEDWVTAYRWLQAHPAFWYLVRADSFDWVTDSGLDDAWTGVRRTKKGTVNVCLEHGGTDRKTNFVHAANTSHFHDIRLDVRERTFEKAYVALAKKVDKYFKLDGTERKNEKGKP